MYTKCVLTFSLTTVDSDFQFNLKKNYWSYKRNNVYEMCIDRSYYYNPIRFFHKLENNYWPYNRKDVYKMCVDRSCYYGRLCFALHFEKQLLAI